MTITNRNLEPGTRLVATYKKARHLCTVEKAEGGEGLAYVLEDGSRFKSPSSAGMKVMGGKAVNGWKFWSLEGDAPAQPEPAAKPAVKARKSTRRSSKRTTYKVIRHHENQDDVPEGQARFWCDGCMESFLAFEEPTQCPSGHRTDDPELNTGAVPVEAEAE
ncbi:MAG: hypothetical protein AB7V46_11665 [Thermomicrobiales bacterium]